MDLKRIIIAAFVGGIIAFIWGMISWLALPWHNMTINNIPNEAAVVEAMKSAMPKEGVYVFPGMPMEMSDENWSAYEAKHAEGPVGVIHYYPGGKPPMPPSVMGIGLLIQILAFGAIAYLVSMAGASLPTYGKRLCFIMAVGTLAFAWVHCMIWNWMSQPLDYTVVMILDGVASTFFAGSAVAAIIKPNSKPINKPSAAPIP